MPLEDTYFDTLSVQTHVEKPFIVSCHVIGKSFYPQRKQFSVYHLTKSCYLMVCAMTCLFCVFFQGFQNRGIIQRAD